MKLLSVLKMIHRPINSGLSFSFSFSFISSSLSSIKVKNDIIIYDLTSLLQHISDA